ncbi:unnamed protein product [Trifolium pratense]|uniref:Uncharacterized protein n=1 Tax=Trifolium pratense TaxID=57577 RepID=A0ACB0IVL7_TRIPR|nr:unnamed protein product [Trifolium pratense]
MTEIQGFGGNKATYGRTEEDFGYSHKSVFRKKEPMSGHEVVLKMIHMLTSISVQLNWTLFELKGNNNVLGEFHSGFMNNRERNETFGCGKRPCYTAATNISYNCRSER